MQDDDGSEDEFGSEIAPDDQELLEALLEDGERDNPIINVQNELDHVPQANELRVPRQALQAIRAGSHDSDDAPRCGNLAREGSISLIEQPEDGPGIELKTPLQRFRSKPSKTLSVTDLVSPSWCQLQYWYTLTKLGKKRSTPAMQQGSAIHQRLEEEVHVTVTVHVETKADRFGLRLLNIIQGLRTLRDTGLTRELEVWGMIDGNVVTGVVDELSHQCPDSELETQATVPPDKQRPITDFMRATSEHQLDPERMALAFRNTGKMDKQKVYISDIKTRTARSLPAASGFRPTAMQLMIYHHLLCQMIAGVVDAGIVLNRFGLDPDTETSAAFMAEIQTLASPGLSLKQLWTWMEQEYRLTFPAGPRSLGAVLKAEYRDAGDGTVLGCKTLLHEPQTLQRYLDGQMRWWRGEQEPQGVCIEEAYKCRSCDFADECSWRNDKIADAVNRMRDRRTKRREASHASPD